MDREVEEKLLEDITSAMERLVGAAESLRLATSAAFQRLAPRIEELAQTVVAADGPVSEVASECFTRSSTSGCRLTPPTSRRGTGRAGGSVWRKRRFGCTGRAGKPFL